ncbi:MAG: DUF1924 domain-containing protein [Nitrosomonadales bacterium]|nr:DUF1924 domain-containing protein [Nitrosomonadales bacterium]
MFRYSSAFVWLGVAAMGLTTLPAFAQTPNEVLATLKTAAAGEPNFQEFSAARGEQFFKVKHGKEWSCTSCHTDNPAAQGKHADTGKAIQPIAPSANAERFTDMAKVEKWFKRNCNDVLGRACTPQEKGDVLSYLLTVKK